MKRFLKIIKFTFLAILSAGLLFFLYFIISNHLFLGARKESNVSYLFQNYTAITDSINDSLFDEDFYQSKVFLLGEIHGYADNQKLDKALLFFLNKKLGVHYYIAEMDSLTAKKLNSFLADSIKDQEALKEVVRAISKTIPQQASQELCNKWSEIYDYNQTLPDSLKIKVIGIDNAPADPSNLSRDSAMLLNFKHFVKELNLENERYYGLFGYFHVLQSATENGGSSFAAKLKNAGIKTTSFVSYTLNSEMYLPKNPEFPTPEDEKVSWINADGPLQLVKGINDLKALAQPNSITLFKLNGAASPYSKSQDLVNVKSRFFGDNIVPGKGIATTDFFQYVFLLSNSKSLTPLK